MALFGMLFGDAQKKKNSVKNNRQRSRALHVETLESRELLSVNPLGIDSHQESAVAFVASAMTPIPEKPAFTKLETDTDNNTVTLTWKDLGADYTYEIHRNNQDISGPNKINGTSFVDTNPFLNKDNVYVLRAYFKEALTETPSNVAIASFAVAPNFTYHVFTENSVTLNWENLGEGYTYKLLKNGYTIQTLTGTAFTDTTFDGTSASYQLYAFKANQGGNYSDLYLVSRDEINPILTGAAEGNGFKLTWSDANPNTSSQNLTWSLIKNGDIIATGSNGNSYFDAVLTEVSSTYTLKVYSPKSETWITSNRVVVNKVQTLDSPQKPTLNVISDTQISVSVNPPTNISGVTHYKIEWTTDSTWKTGISSATINITNTTYQVESLKSESTYYFRVTSIDENGAKSAASQVASAQTKIQLTAPSNVKVTDPTTNSLTVSWNAVNNATSYFVQLSTDGTNWTNATTTKISDTSYEITGLNFGTKYQIRVKATGDAEKTIESEYSEK
ncbi:MAG: fibronectin type III domain-containing protein, partial [Thermoguttaceae bacterium]